MKNNSELIIIISLLNISFFNTMVFHFLKKITLNTIILSSNNFYRKSTSLVYSPNPCVSENYFT